MGDCLSVERTANTNELENLDKYNEDSVVYKGITQQRTVTDKWAMVFLGVFLLVNAGFVIYLCTQGDIFRLFNGYDNCGNVCGRKNPVDSRYSCSGQDMTSKKFFLETGDETNINRQCLTDCSEEPGYIPFFDRCIPKPKNKNDILITNSASLKSIFQLITQDLYMCIGEIIGLCLLALVYSVIVVALLRYATRFTVWFVIILACVVCIAITIYLWVTWSGMKTASEASYTASELETRKNNTLVGAIIFTVFSVVILLILLIMRNRIELVLQLIKEAGKAVTCMPALLFEPLLTFIAVGIGGILWIYFTFVSADAGTLTQVSSRLYEYVPNGGIFVANVFALFTLIWMFYFIVDCQHMIVAGAVAKWFFTRDKSNLGSPIKTSGYNVVRYHLGTIAFGSLLVTLIVIIRETIKQALNSAKQNKSGWIVAMKCCIEGCLSMIESLLKLFTKNAYILTAIYGYSFCRAGKRAFQLIRDNAFKIAAINSVSDFVLFLMKAFILIATLIVGYEIFSRKEGLNSFFYPLMVVGIFAFCVAHCFLTTYEMAIETIFICFCEDYEQNDGVEKPYFMSKELMKFVEDSNKILGKDEDQQTEG